MKFAALLASLFLVSCSIATADDGDWFDFAPDDAAAGDSPISLRR